MKLLFLNSAHSWGGNEKWSLAAAKGLAERGHQVWFGHSGSLFPERAGESHIEWIEYPFAGNYDWGTMRAIRQDLERLEIDVVIPTKQREYFLGGLAAWKLPRPKVVARLGIDRPIRKFRNRLAFNRLFDGVIVNSRRIVEVLAECRGFDAAKCRVIYNGIELPDLDPAVRPHLRGEMGLDESEFVILGVGRLTGQKGFDLAIRALANVPQGVLLIAGDGEAEPLRALASEAGVTHRVRFLGFRTDIPALLQAADLFWLTSRSEGMANVLLEAMASALPACAFDISGVSELIEDGVQGIVVPFGDLASLSEATNRLVKETNLRLTLGRASRQRVAEHFSPERMIDETERYLETFRSMIPES